MPVTIEGLEADLDRVEREVEGAVRAMAEETGNLIIAFSPVRTGFFVSNWNDSIGAPDTSVRGVPSGGITREFGDPSFDVQFTWDVQDGDIHFANNVDYADLLDGGSSQQAPQGVTDPVTSLVDSRFRRVVL